jgi:hypothetical protein
MITTAVSGSTEVAEELISYFVDIGNTECSGYEGHRIYSIPF